MRGGGLRLALAALPALVLVAQPAPPAPRSDAQLADLLRAALGSSDTRTAEEALKAVGTHRFTSLRSPERELSLYAEGVLLARLGQPARGALALRKLERLFPQSPHLGEAQVLLAQEAISKRRYKEAETRLRRAIQAEIPVESKRRAQELLLWTFVAQKQPERGLPVVDALHPLGGAKPSEQGLSAMGEILAQAGRRTEAEAAVAELGSLYPGSRLLSRADLAIGRMQGRLGDAHAAAQRFQALIRNQPDSPEADEARLALATLLSEQKLAPDQAKTFPTPESLLSEIRRLENKGEAAGRTQLVQLRLHMQQGRWKEALELIGRIRTQPPGPGGPALETYRGQALRAYAQQLLDGHQLDSLLPFLDAEGVGSLTAEQRRLTAQALASTGLPEGAAAVLRLAPARERAALRQAILAATSAESHPATVLGLSGPTGTPLEQLLRAEAAVTRQDFQTARMALPKATAGPRRIAALLAHLRRPRAQDESLATRRNEAEGWLRQARERGSDRDPLAILVADLRAQSGDWKGALALYPPAPAPEHLGWVALMRATALARLGRKAEAQAILKAAEASEAFRMERKALAQSLLP